jgi:hypothetical protein
MLRRRVLLVLAVLDEIVDHGGIRQSRGVAGTARFVLCAARRNPSDLGPAGSADELS